MSFKSARSKTGKKAIEVAEYMGVSAVAVSQWENGVFYPTIDKLQKLAAYYGCTIEELLDDNPAKEKEADDAEAETDDAGV